jgi:hypothetical protein
MVAFLLVLALLIVVLAIVASPWRRSHGPAVHHDDDQIRAASADVLDLEVARDNKYREIRDAELDRQTGKLSDDDFNAIDAGLRAEAVEILKVLDRARSRLEKLRAAEAEPESEPELDAVRETAVSRAGDE